jgi:SulP family sulfate permease
MFFGAAQNALKTLLNTNEDTNIVILNMKNVTMIDITAMVALKSIIDNFKNHDKKLIFSGLNTRILKKLTKANFEFDENNLKNFIDIDEAIAYSKTVI